MTFNKDGQRIMGAKDVENTDYPMLPWVIVIGLAALVVALSQFDNAANDAVFWFVSCGSVAGVILLIIAAFKSRAPLLEKIFGVLLPLMVAFVAWIYVQTRIGVPFFAFLTGDDGGTNPRVEELGIWFLIVQLVALFGLPIGLTIWSSVRLFRVKKRTDAGKIMTSVLIAFAGALGAIFLAGMLANLG